jgi:hypothetical protein
MQTESVEAPMKYLILIYSNPMSRELWQSFSREERAEGIHAYEKLTEDLAASRELIAGDPLADASLSKRVEVRDGQTLTTDGPFAEAKEHLAGYFLVQCDSLERAVEIAARVPEAELGLVEVRPTMDLSGFEI